MKPNHRKRIEHSNRLMSELQSILNDSSVMPNADCPDLIVSVSKIIFGNTVREIYLLVNAEWKKNDGTAVLAHQRYLNEAKQLGEDTYIDLTDVFCYPEITASISEELKRRLNLQYLPIIHLIEDLGEC